MNLETIRIGLAGLGTVGTGLVQILENNRTWINKRLGKDLIIKNILVSDLQKKRPILPDAHTTLTDRTQDLIDDPELDIIVELIGGLDTAYNLIKNSLLAGKSVVTANKALLAERGPELFELAAQRDLGLYYEASVAGGIPIVQTLKESLAGNRIKSLTGILNGTANFILSEMTQKNLAYEQALALAQDKGYAEADPALDVDGLDAAHKLTVLIRLAYGQDYPLHDLPVYGIRGVDQYDILRAGDFGYVLKLIAQVKEKSGSLQAGVFPALVRNDHMLAKVDGPFNAILLEGNAVGPIMLYGQGAGDLPTGSAVLADIMTLVNRKSFYNNTGFLEISLPKASILPPELTAAKHYFRFTVQDRPGVLSVLSGIMGEQNISIAQVVQKQEANGKTVPVVFLTHTAQLKDVNSAMNEISKLDFIKAPTVHYRLL
ncbi:MAG: homoserine dehydrogenase [Desulfovermiculus sp.]|nr:homoserine dehydrogenase [Desulfovermiculus sp.]